MGEGEKQGLGDVLAAAVPNAAAEACRQLDLLSAEDEPGASPFDQALDEMAAGFSQPRRGRGRPVGSRNRRTEDWQRLVLSTHRSPLLVLADVYSMPVEELAKRLKCDLLDAAKLQITAARELAPYVHQRLPQAVDLNVGGALPTLTIVMPGAAAPGSPASAEAGEVVDLLADDIVEYQGLSAAAAEHSDSAYSDGSAQDVDMQGETAVRPTDLGSVP